jgi:pimeloyl-ACP methyl ester carboxylesterase
MSSGRFAARRWAAAALLLLPACRVHQKPPSRRITLGACRLEGSSSAAQCGTYEVWEDRQAAQGRRLRLKVVVVPALARDPAPDPLFLLAGGPGQGITRLAGNVLPAFERIRQHRDIVLVDQRGTGGSNPLDCRLVREGAPVKEALSEVGFPGDRLRRCLDAYDADPRLYTTPIAMDDLDEVRGALGYESINLWGISYGTRAALVFMRDHGAHVRSAVLDGVAPYANPLPAYFARDGQRALDLLFRHCAEDPACARAYPDLAARFGAFVGRLREHPVSVSVPDPLSGVPSAVTVRHLDFVSGLRGVLYSADSTSLVPLVIDRAIHGDFAPFLAQLTEFQREYDRSMSVGLMFSVLCAEDAPFIGDGEIERLAQGTFLGPGTAQEILRVCAFWPHGTLPAAYREPVRSDVPTLLLSGELDPVTPPHWAEEVKAGLVHSRHVILPGVGHGSTWQGCVPDLVERFVQQPGGELDTQCVQALKRPPFFVSFAGPEP